MGDRQARSAFDTVALAQVAAIRRIGRRRLVASRDLEDFTQEVLLRAYASRSQLRDADRLPQWIQTIARHTAQDWNRKRRPDISDLLAELPDSAPSPHQSAESGERWDAFLDALASLHPVDRDLLYSHVVDGSPYETLQARHGLSRSAVGVRLHRARRRLRRRLRFLLGVEVAWVGRKTTASAGGLLAMKWVYGAAIGAVCALIGGWLWHASGDSAGITLDRAAAAAKAQPGNTASSPRRAASGNQRSAPVHSADSRSQTATTPGAMQPRPTADSARSRDSQVRLDASASANSVDSVPADLTEAQRTERRLYAALADMWPRYIDAVERSNAIQDTRPAEPGEDATEAEMQEWREKDAAFQAALKPADAECWQYRDRLTEMFPTAIVHEVFHDDDGARTGYTWRLHTDIMRQAAGGRLPSDG